MNRKSIFLFLASCTLLLVACTTVDLYERSVSIPKHAWQNSYKPSFTFTIKDSESLYQPFLILRHNDKYSFNNIYVNVYVKVPGSDSAVKIRRDLQLATDNEGWLASGMDDIYEHRIKLGEPETFKPGDYTFTLEQIMRQNPLENVLNVGMRIEKKH